MATKHPQGSGGPRGDDIPVLDKVSCKSELAKVIPALRIAVTVLFATFFGGDDWQAVIYHCQIDNERRTFLKGKWDDLGLDDPEAEQECHELHGKSLIQCQISSRGTIYVLTQDGQLWSKGDNRLSQLGRQTHDVSSTTFGRVPIAEPVLAIACGAGHCLALTTNKVFAFGYDNCGQTGVGRGGPVKEPTEIYRGTGNKAPCQIATGWGHSAILTTGGQALTFGRGDHGSTGHGGTNHIDKPKPVKSIKGNVEQIGCTDMATFFLVDGKMFGCGYNGGSRLGVGHDKAVTVPTLVNTEGHNITSFRCSWTLVVAYTELRDALVWGECDDNAVIKVPQIEHLEFPRDFFSNGEFKDTGSSVHPDNWINKPAEMKDLSSKMLELKMERTGSGESYGQGGVSPGEHEAERLAENGRLMEEMSTLQTQLTSEKAERIALETKSAQQQTAYDDLLAAHEMLKRENASIRNKYDDEKEKHNRLKVEHQDLKKKKIGTLSEDISLPLLHVVVNMVGKNWYRLGLKLGVPDFQLDNIDHICPNLPDKALVTLNKWYELAPQEATRDYLADCLVYVDRKDIADKIRDKKRR